MLFSILYILGDGLCPSGFLLMFCSSLFLFVISANRIRKMTNQSIINDLIEVQWAELIGWHFLEGLFFYATGHQATFPTIQWNAAFIGGFSGTEFGSQEANTFLGYIIPIILIGWNTYIARIWFGLLLPLLLIAPFAIWMVVPSVRPIQLASNHPKPDLELNSTSHGSLGHSSILAQELAKGEVFLLENKEEARSRVFGLCVKYSILECWRVFATMLSAAFHRRHLMVWKIFAPRFIFEGIGCLVSLMFITIGYLTFVRIQNSVSAYYYSVQSLDKDK